MSLNFVADNITVAKALREIAAHAFDYPIAPWDSLAPIAQEEWIKRADLVIQLCRVSKPSTEYRMFGHWQRVRKIKGSSWQGPIVGFYSTQLTPSGYCVMSEREYGNVQVYPEAALEALPSDLT